MACEEGSEWRKADSLWRGGKTVVREAYLVIRRDSRDLRDKRDGSDGRRFEVRSSRFSELRTWNFELRIAPVAHSVLVSLAIHE